MVLSASSSANQPVEFSLSPAPTMVIMMGMGGSGKSTIAKEKFAGLPRIDCDVIKASHPAYNPKAPELVHDWSSRQFERSRFAALGKGVSFVADSTGKNVEKMVRWIADAQDAGFRVHICFVRVALETALARNAKRTRTVPASVIMEAAGAVEKTFPIVASLADSSEVVQND